MACPNGLAVIELVRNQLWLARERRIPITEIRMSPVAYRRMVNHVEHATPLWAPNPRGGPVLFEGIPVRVLEQQDRHVRVMVEGDR